jgi:hypothetical protein
VWTAVHECSSPCLQSSPAAVDSPAYTKPQHKEEPSRLRIPPPLCVG